MIYRFAYILLKVHINYIGTYGKQSYKLISVQDCGIPIADAKEIP